MKKTLTCIECPRGCTVTVDTDTRQTQGNLCPKGGAYALSELIEPRRVVTSTVCGKNCMIPVKTDRPVRKTAIFSVMEKIRGIKVFTDTEIGAILLENADGEGANIIATKRVRQA